MVESSKKTAHDLDREMLFYPSSYTREKAEAELAQMSAQAAGRRKNDKVQRCQQKEPAGKRRKHMTFSELTDFVLERKVSTVAELWQAGG